jgi:hypothetical protein
MIKSPNHPIIQSLPHPLAPSLEMVGFHRQHYVGKGKWFEITPLGYKDGTPTEFKKVKSEK